MKSLKLIFILIALFINSSAYAQWNSQIIDEFSSYGAIRPKIALDINGNPNVVYLRPPNDDLYYATWTGTGWIRESITDLSGASNQCFDILITSTGEIIIPVVKGFTTRDDRLRIYLKENTNIYEYDYSLSDPGMSNLFNLCTKIIEKDVHIIVSGGVLAHFIFNLETKKFTLYEIIDQGSIGGQCSLAIDEYNNLHVSYYDNGLRYAYYDVSMWSTQYIETGTNIGNYNNVLIKDGKPHVFYYDGVNGDLKHAVLE